MNAFVDEDRWWISKSTEGWMVEPPGDSGVRLLPTFDEALRYFIAHQQDGPRHLTCGRLNRLPRYAVVVAVDAYKIPTVYQKDDVGRWRPAGDPGWSSSAVLSEYDVTVVWVPENGQPSDEPGSLSLDFGVSG